MKQPLISIITPIFNHEKYINTCIQSILEQSYQNWEQIIVDDCSTDKTCLIIEDYIKVDKRIKLIKNKKRLGIFNLSLNYNRALSVSRGSLVAILEGDDYMPRDKLAIQVNPYINDESIAMSYGDWIMVTDKGVDVYLRSYGYDEMRQNILIGDIAKRFAKLNFDICSPTVMINKKKLVKIGGFQKSSLYPFTDIPTYLALSKEGQFIYQKEIVGYYRRSSQSEWFNFASSTAEMGRRHIAILANTFLNEINTPIPLVQKKKLVERKTTKGMSIFKNKMLFENNLTNKNTIFVIGIFFKLRLIIYKIEQFIYYKIMRKNIF